MKKQIYYVAAIAFMVSCSQATDKNAELQQLKTERDKLNQQIATLEAEINPQQKPAEEKMVAVKTTDAAECVFEHYIQVQGTVDGDQNIAVSPQMPGIVTAVYVTEGTNVKKGQVLAELDDQITRQTLEEVNTQLALANSMYEKQAALWEKKIGSEVQYLQAKAGKESLEQRVKTIKEQLKLSKVVSPISGTVESVPLRVGQMASPGMPTSTIRVINMSVAKITADVSETYASRIKNGNVAIVTFPDIGKEVETKLSFTSRFIDPTNRTFKAECKISSKDIELRANMIANIKIKDYTNEKAFCVPVNLVQSNQEGKFLIVAIQDGANWKSERRFVKTGMDYNGVMEITEGLNVGDKIVVSGFQGLNAGQKLVF
jgi:RND family efflux transporter MFP subunit